MIVENLTLRNFRNYESASIQFSKGLNVITGRNAQGKTNLLESLIYLSLTRSHRINDDKKMIKDDEAFADIKCEFLDGGTKRNIEAIIHNKGKTLIVHKQPVKRSSEFIGLLNVILFSPDDLTLFNDAPKERRKILNQEITKISSKYLQSLNQYQNLLKERNLLLKQFNFDHKLLDTLDEQMSKEEVVIIKYRKDFIKSIDTSITPLYQQLSSDTCKVHVQYQSCIDEEVTYENILKKHLENRSKDIENHVTTFGIHREDMIFEMDGKNLIHVASQGQKRMTVLSFKMALLKYVEERTNKKPILLLDDVLSELDSQRQRKLMEMVGNEYQCILTTTEIPQFMKNKNMKVFQIENGKILEGGNV